jgi:DNA-binding NarL/FixJ family response regulator
VTATENQIKPGSGKRFFRILLTASGMTNLGIAKRLGITRVTVTTWRNRFAANVSVGCSTSLALVRRARSAMTRSPRW